MEPMELTEEERATFDRKKLAQLQRETIFLSYVNRACRHYRDSMRRDNDYLKAGDLSRASNYSAMAAALALHFVCMDQWNFCTDMMNHCTTEIGKIIDGW